MTRRRGKRIKATEVLERLDAELGALSEIVGNRPPRGKARQEVDSKLRELVTRGETLLRDLDPVRQPRFVFDPGDPAVVGRFIALALIAQERMPLVGVQSFHGSGVYALYYNGQFAAYVPISGTETPIYVGKADPKSDTARTPVDQGTRLYSRLNDHRRNIGKAETTLDIADFECRFLVVQTGWQTAAEAYLIDLFQPAWNSETDICYGLGKHGDAPSTRANRRSPWDTLHPGRDWAGSGDLEDARPRKRILHDLAAHFSGGTTYSDVDPLLKSFIDELRQL